MQGFSLLSNDPNQYTVQAPDGRAIPIAKNGLSPQYQAQIEALPPGMPASMDPTVPVTSGPQGSIDPAMMMSRDPASVAPAVPASMPKPAVTPGAYQPTAANMAKYTAPPASPPGFSMPNLAGIGKMTEQYAQMMPGYQMGANAMGTIGKANQEMYQTDERLAGEKAQNIQSTVKSFEQNTADIDNEMKRVMQGVASKEIDPHRFWNSRTDGQKVMLGISAFLSGFNGGKNYIQEGIDRDVKLQMEDKSNAMNLYKANLDAYRDKGAALNATILQKNAAVAAQMEQAAAKSGSKTAMAQVQMWKAEQLQKLAPNVMALAAFQTKEQVRHTGIPTDQVPPMLANDEDFQKRGVVIGPNTYLAKTDKDAEEVKNFLDESNPTMKALSDLKHLQSDNLWNGKMPLSEAKALADQKLNVLEIKIGKTMAGRGPNQQEVEALHSALRGANSFDELKNALARTQGMMDIVQEDIDEKLHNRVWGYKSLRDMGAKRAPAPKSGSYKDDSYKGGSKGSKEGSQGQSVYDILKSKGAYGPG